MAFPERSEKIPGSENFFSGKIVTLNWLHGWSQVIRSFGECVIYTLERIIRIIRILAAPPPPPPPPLGILCRRAVFRRVFRFPDFQEKLAKNSPYSPITRLLLAKTRQKLAKTRLNSPKTRLNSPKLAPIWVQILVHIRTLGVKMCTRMRKWRAGVTDDNMPLENTKKLKLCHLYV